MDLYADNLADYIYQENDVDKKRALLLEVEAEIKKLMGEQEKRRSFLFLNNKIGNGNSYQYLIL